MTTFDLKLLLERAETWPEAAQAELVAVAKEIEQELSENTYEATDEELRIIDEAITSIEAGEGVSEAEMEATFAKFRR
jgi:hypothetical protein